MLPHSPPLPLPSVTGGRVFFDDGYLDAYPPAQQQQSGISERGPEGGGRKGGTSQASPQRVPGTGGTVEKTPSGLAEVPAGKSASSLA